MGRETDNWRFIPAAHFTKVTGKRKVRVGVIHDMEFHESATAAEDIAIDFKNAGPKDLRSAHVCVDNDSIIQCVHDNDVAYAAPGCNNDGIQVEVTGFGRQTHAEWLDTYGLLLLQNVANVVAQYSVKYDLPPVRITDSQLRAGEKGWVGHDQVSRVYKKSDHSDPGPNFPWTYLFEKVGPLYQARMRTIA